jgi:hypothetical protein
MSQRSYLLVCALVFSLVFILHVLRLFYGWGVTIGGRTVPIWASRVGTVVAVGLAYEGFRLRK